MARETEIRPVVITVVVGTRPEIVKMAPVLAALREDGTPFSLVHTGQHYDREMSEVFLEELDVGKPDVFLDVGSGTHAKQTAEALLRLEEPLAGERPDLVLVEGDTNTVLAAALSAVKLQIDVAHVEAGPRSYDPRMPEEQNRRLVDHLSSFLFAPSEQCQANLRRESVWGQVFVTGNPVIDACLKFLPLAERKSKALDRIRAEEFGLATAHRAENVDDPRTLKEIVRIFTSSPVPVVFPLHPRTRDRLKEFGLYDALADSPNVEIIPPQGYFDFLLLMKHARFILTDSGGIQQEATAPNLRKKVFVLRTNTESPEAVAAGYVEILGTEAALALPRIERFAENPKVPAGASPYGDGHSGGRIAEILKDLLEGGDWPLRRSLV
ncbi:MAG: UDP-N-acetylglucosamine 2-epimerase (non-hydrolyzing) [bacterium]